MILGKKYDPEQEEAYKEILELEKKCKNVERKMLEVSDEVMSRTELYFIIPFFDPDRRNLKRPS